MPPDLRLRSGPQHRTSKGEKLRRIAKRRALVALGVALVGILIAVAAFAGSARGDHAALRGAKTPAIAPASVHVSSARRTTSECSRLQLSADDRNLPEPATARRRSRRLMASRRSSPRPQRYGPHDRDRRRVTESRRSSTISGSSTRSSACRPRVSRSSAMPGWRPSIRTTPTRLAGRARRRSMSSGLTPWRRARTSCWCWPSRTTTRTSSTPPSTCSTTTLVTCSRRATAKASSAWIRALLARQHQIFDGLSAKGVTLFASSGDKGLEPAGVRWQRRVLPGGQHPRQRPGRHGCRRDDPRCGRHLSPGAIPPGDVTSANEPGTGQAAGGGGFSVLFKRPGLPGADH